MTLQPATRVIVAEGLAIGLLGLAAWFDALPAELGPRWLVLSAHVLCAGLLVGTAAAGALTLARADPADAAVCRFVSRTVTLADAVFTGPAAAGLVVTGAELARAYGGVAHVPWIREALVAIAAAGFGWLVVLVPLQELLYRAAGDPRRWERIAKRYPVPGVVTGALLLVVLALMVAKPS